MRACIRAVVIASLVLGSQVASARAADPLVVPTSSGLVRGVDAGATHEWRGIPYIASPLGELRWRAPQPPESWSGVRDATHFASRCLQLSFSEPPFFGSEDCVYLNIFAPAAPAGTPLPVMVHLHGGSNTGFWAYTDASTFTDHGVIVVTVEYRLGVFGFIGHPLLSEEAGAPSGEYGLLDQIAALQWIRDNIAAFGGDPGNVTLFGESAGSYDATVLVASPPAHGLFQRAALQTEAYWPLNGFAPIEEAEFIGQEVVDAIGCSGASDVLGCMRSTPATDLVAALGPAEFNPWVGGTVLPGAPLDLIGHDPDPVPLIIGSNREEGAVFVPAVYTGEAYSPHDYMRDTSTIIGPQAGHLVRQLYPVAAYDSAKWASVAAFTDAVFTCPVRKLGLASSSNVWRYLYTHGLENDEWAASLRATHFMDEPILWHSASVLEGFGLDQYQFTPAEDQLADVLATYWTNFAKTGDPNGSGAPIWPAYTQGEESIQKLDTQVTTLGGWHVPECEFWNRVPDLFLPARFLAQAGPTFLPPRERR